MANVIGSVKRGKTEHEFRAIERNGYVHIIKKSGVKLLKTGACMPNYLGLRGWVLCCILSKEKKNF